MTHCSRGSFNIMIKKILITGISGQLGSNLAYLLYDRLKDFDIEIIGVYNKNYANSRYIQIVNANSVFSMDNSSKVFKFDPDLVIHCAALTNVDLCESRPDLAFRSNVLFTRDVCTSFSNSNIIYISTDNVYYGGNCLHTESDATVSRNIYGMTKIFGENIVKTTCNNYLIFRTNIYGWDNRDRSNSFLEKIFRDLTNGLDTRLFYDVIYCPISINLLFEVIFECLKIGATGTYNLVGPSISKKEFGETISNVFELNSCKIKPISIDELHLEAKRAKILNLSNKKISDIYPGIRISTLDQVMDMRRLYKMGYKEKLAEFIKING